MESTAKLLPTTQSTLLCINILVCLANISNTCLLGFYFHYLISIHAFFWIEDRVACSQYTSSFTVMFASKSFIKISLYWWSNTMCFKRTVHIQVRFHADHKDKSQKIQSLIIISGVCQFRHKKGLFLIKPCLLG